MATYTKEQAQERHRQIDAMINENDITAKFQVANRRHQGLNLSDIE